MSDLHKTRQLRESNTDKKQKFNQVAVTRKTTVSPVHTNVSTG